MYAVILIKGKQYRVEEGQEVAVDKINGKEGDIVTIEKILAAQGNGDYLFGNDASKVSVKAKIVEHFRGDKVTVLKYKPKSRYRRTLGHKQQLTLIKIDSIDIPGAKKEKVKSQESKVKSQEKTTKPKQKKASSDKPASKTHKKDI